MLEQVAQNSVATNSLVSLSPASVVMRINGLESEPRSGLEMISLPGGLPCSDGTIIQDAHSVRDYAFLRLQALCSIYTPSVRFPRHDGFIVDHWQPQSEPLLFHRGVSGLGDSRVGLYQNQLEHSHDECFLEPPEEPFLERRNQGLGLAHPKTRREGRSRRTRTQNHTYVMSSQEQDQTIAIHESHPPNNHMITSSQTCHLEWLDKSNKRPSGEEVVQLSSMVRRRRRLTTDETEYLTEKFLRNERPDRKERVKMAQDLSLDPRIIQVWFQNRRAKIKRDDSMARDFALVEQDSEYEYEYENKWKHVHEMTPLDSVEEYGSNYENESMAHAGAYFNPCVNTFDLAPAHKSIGLQRPLKTPTTQAITAEQTVRHQWIQSKKPSNIPIHASQENGPDAFVGYCCSTVIGPRSDLQVHHSSLELLNDHPPFTMLTNASDFSPRGSQSGHDTHNLKAEIPFPLPSVDFDLGLGLLPIPGWDCRDLGIELPLTSSESTDITDVELESTCVNLEHILGTLKPWTHEPDPQLVDSDDEGGADTVSFQLRDHTKGLIASIPSNHFCGSMSHTNTLPKPTLRRRLRQNPIPKHQQALTLITPLAANYDVN